MADSKSNGDESKAAEISLPKGVKVPSSIDISLLETDVMELVTQLSVDRINSAFASYDSQYKQRGSEIKNPKGYLKGVLKGAGAKEAAGKYGLPGGVRVPDSITEEMLQEGALVDILKNMSTRDINKCFRDYDDQMSKKSSDIRNKNAYLLGIIKSGNHYNLPHGVTLPPSISLAMLRGGLLETLQKLPATHANLAFTEYDEMVQKRGDSIRNKESYLAGIVHRMKRTYDEETAELEQKQAASPNKAKSPDGKKKDSREATKEQPAKKEGESEGTLSLVTESFAKVTNELVVERSARSELENKVKASELQLDRLLKDLKFERSLREAAEEKAQILEKNRDQQLQNKGGSNSNDQVKQLELELSIERGLRDKAEKLLQTAERRVEALKQELQAKTKPPYGDLLAAANGHDDTAVEDVTINLPGLADLASKKH